MTDPLEPRASSVFREASKQRLDENDQVMEPPTDWLINPRAKQIDV